MQTYSEFQPTAFDTSGLGLDDRQSWLVAPVSHTRDSDILIESNFQAALDSLGGESDTVEVHRFGHWGPGWFEIILIDPADVERVAIAEDVESALANYPLLDGEDFSRREYDAAIDAIHQQSPYTLSPEQASDVFEWLSRKEPQELENRDGTGAYPDSEAIKRAILNTAPELFTIDDLAEMLEDGNSSPEDLEYAQGLQNAVNRGKRQLAEYCQRLPEYSDKASKAHAEAVEAIRAELLDMVAYRNRHTQRT